jgi:hypothetical protein
VSFFEKEKQKNIYELLKVDYSTEEVNKRLFYEDNKQFFDMKEKYKGREKGLSLRENTQTLNEVSEKTKPAEEKQSHIVKSEKRAPINLSDADLQDMVLTQHLKKRINLI